MRTCQVCEMDPRCAVLSWPAKGIEIHVCAECFRNACAEIGADRPGLHPTLEAQQEMSARGIAVAFSGRGHL